MSREYTIEKYEELISMLPEDRVAEKSGDVLHDKIAGILIAFHYKARIRDGWIDIITLRDAEREILELIKQEIEK